MAELSELFSLVKYCTLPRYILLDYDNNMTQIFNTQSVTWGTPPRHVRRLLAGGGAKRASSGGFTGSERMVEKCWKPMKNGMFNNLLIVVNSGKHYYNLIYNMLTLLVIFITFYNQNTYG